jgi:hypothetical protein
VLTVLPGDSTVGTRLHYLCRCDSNLNRGQSKSCGCSNSEARRTKPFWALFGKLKSQAQKMKHAMGLTFEQFLEFTKEKQCHYCKDSLIWKEFAKWKTNLGGYNLDRKDNSKGYSKENCVPCCGDCNKTRGDRYTYEKFMVLAPVLQHIKNARKQK